MLAISIFTRSKISLKVVMEVMSSVTDFVTLSENRDEIKIIHFELYIFKTRLNLNTLVKKVAKFTKL